MKSIVEDALSRAEMQADSPIYLQDQSIETDQELEKILSELKTNIAVVGCGGGTPLADGIYTANAHLISDCGKTPQDPQAECIEILLTDGCETCGGDPIAAAQEAADAGITIYPIGLGSGVCVSVLEEIATITGGTYYYVSNPEDLQAVYDAIYKEITIDTRPWNVDVVEVTTPNDIIVIPDSCSLTPNNVIDNTITWNNIGNGPMGAGETVTITCTVKSTVVGEDRPVQVYGDAVVNYKDSKGNQLDPVLIPQAYLTQIDLWIGTNKELDELIKKLNALEGNKWTALSTYFDVTP